MYSAYSFRLPKKDNSINHSCLQGINLVTLHSGAWPTGSFVQGIEFNLPGLHSCLCSEKQEQREEAEWYMRVSKKTCSLKIRCINHCSSYHHFDKWGYEIFLSGWSGLWRMWNHDCSPICTLLGKKWITQSTSNIEVCHLSCCMLFSAFNLVPERIYCLHLIIFSFNPREPLIEPDPAFYSPLKQL